MTQDKEMERLENNLKVIEETLYEFIYKKLQECKCSFEAIAILTIPQKIIGVIAHGLLQCKDKIDLLPIEDRMLLEALVTNYEHLGKTIEINEKNIRKNCDEN